MKLDDKSIFRANPLLKKDNVKLNYTQDQLENFVRYSNNPIDFIQENFKIVTLDKGLINIELYEFQKDIINLIHENRFSILKLPRQSSKCQLFTTNLTIRNKTSGEIIEIPIGELFDHAKSGKKS